MKCEVCGNKIKKGQTHCDVCGALVNENDDVAELNIEKKLSDEVKKNIKRSSSIDRIRTSRLIKFLIPVVAILTIIIFIVAGTVIFTSVKEAKEMEKATNDITPRPDGVKICVSYGVLYNSNGEANNKFEGNEDLDFEPTFDNEMAMICDDKKVYYVDGNLKPRLIAKKADEALISKNSGAILYGNSKKKTLDYYDPETGHIYHISDDCLRVSLSAISSNGQYVVFYDDNRDRMMLYEKGGRLSSILGGYHHCMAISDDGQRAFFRNYEENGDVIIYYNNGDSRIIEKNLDLDCIISNDCRELLISNTNEIRYFKDGYDEVKEIYSGEYIEDISFFEKTLEKGYCFYFESYVNQPSLEQFVLQTSDHYYYFYNAEEKQIDLQLNVSDPNQFYIYDGGLRVLSVVSRKMVETCVNESELTRKEYDTQFEVKEVECNEDMSIIYAGSYDNELFRLNDNKFEFVTQYKGDYYGIEYDKYTDKFYYAYNYALYSITNDAGTIKQENSDCSGLTSASYKYSYDHDYFAYSDNSSIIHIIIYGNDIYADD